MPSQPACNEPRIYQVEGLAGEVEFFIQVGDLKQNILSIIACHLKHDIDAGNLVLLSADAHQPLLVTHIAFWVILGDFGCPCRSPESAV